MWQSSRSLVHSTCHVFDKTILSRSNKIFRFLRMCRRYIRYIRNTWSHWPGALKSQKKNWEGEKRKRLFIVRSQSCLHCSCRLVDQNNLATDLLVKSFNNRESKLWNTTFCLWAPGRSIVKFPKQTKFNTECPSEFTALISGHPGGVTPGRYAGIAGGDPRDL